MSDKKHFLGSYFFKFSYLIVLFVFFQITLQAKEIKGVIRSASDNEAIEGVLVSIKCANFSKNTSSDSLGLFSFDIPDDVIYFDLYFSHPFFISEEIRGCKDTEISINLLPQEHFLTEVVIKSNWIYRRDGNLVVDVAQIPNAKNLNTEQVLKHIPGITKSPNNGGYSLNGKSAVIFINGIKQNISANSLNIFLENLPADAVSSIELISLNTGTYSSGVEAAIDITIDSNMQLGYSFQPYLFTSIIPTGLNNFGGNVFYMTKFSRLLFHNTLAYSNDNDRFEQVDSLMINGTRLLDNSRTTYGRNNVLTYRASLVYSLHNNNTLNFNSFIYSDFDRKRSKHLSLSDLLFEKRKERSDLYNFSIAYRIPSSKKEFYGTIAYAISYGGQHSNANYKYENKSLDDRADLDMEGWMNTWSVDFVSNLNKWRLYYGFQMDYNSVWDKADYSSVGVLGAHSIFSGAEFLPAIYTQFRYNFNEALSLRAGARLENTFYRYNYLSQKNKSRDTNIFPSLLIQYNTKNTTTIVGLTSNINRPKYEWMLPGIKKVNEYIYDIGNPEIRPSRSYSLIFYNTFFKYAQLNLSYVLTKNLYGNVYEVSKQTLIRSHNNIADNKAFRANIVLPYALFEKKITGQLQTNLSYNKLSNFKNNFILPSGRSAHYWATSFVANINYNPTDKLNFSIEGSYLPRQTATLYDNRSNFYLDLDFYYSFLKDKSLTLGLNASALFARDRVGTSYFLDNQYHTTTKNIGPFFRVSLKWRFNKGQRVVEEYQDYIPGTNRLR